MGCFKLAPFVFGQSQSLLVRTAHATVIGRNTAVWALVSSAGEDDA